ncbi:MAG TPA: winged helix-turn-helix domain-containing protein [Solirubrobacterales bacterium]|nr:winged helix-turn-helix domain-containing protein [Solirubrobacterales bacterium]
MGQEGPIIVDQRLVKATAHPTRVHILNLLYDEPSSPSKLAKRIPDVSLKLVSHHIKVLESLDCVELLRTIEHGGRTEHIYRATKRQFFSAKEWEEVEPKARQPITTNILRLVSEDIGASLAAGKFDERPDNHLSRTPIGVDDEGWREIVSILARALHEVLDVSERSAERVRLSGDHLMKIRVVMMQFLVPRKLDEGGEDEEFLGRS